MDPITSVDAVGRCNKFQYTDLPTPVVSIQRLRKLGLSETLKRPLDRVNVLGNEDGNYGHQGCVNAVNWAQDGEVLLTGGDDATVRLWRVDPSETESQYPLVCRSVINTGHRANIFNVRMLPFSTRIVTCSGDRQIRVFDASLPLDIRNGKETNFSAQQCDGQTISCHTGRVKKLVTEDSPDLFLSLAEDGTVRQHDLRSHHREECPIPLVQMKHELSAISVSPVTPYQFVVVGDSPYGHLFDRRHIGRVLADEWGVPPQAGQGVTHCVRTFGRPPGSSSHRRGGDHITGCRVSPTNGHEVVLTYSGDKIYLFSTRDEPSTTDSMEDVSSALLPSNDRESRHEVAASPNTVPSQNEERDNENPEGDDPERSEGRGSDMDGHPDGPNSNEFKDEVLNAPVILPRQSYVGARNVETVKDVNFLGPWDEHVVSGSDDGNWFMWDKLTGRLRGIYEGDGSVVNVVEGHPYLPLVAVSGIDYTVKLFAPAAAGESEFSRFENADRIVEENERLSQNRVPRYDFADLLGGLRLSMLVSRPGEEEAQRIECPTQ